MRRREFLHAVAASTVALALPGRVGAAGTSRAKAGQVMTVTGAIDARDLGMTLAHEHLCADLRPFDEQATAPLPPDVEQVVELVLPYLQAIRRMGCRSLVDCTATTLGRNPALIRRLSEASDLY